MTNYPIINRTQEGHTRHLKRAHEWRTLCGRYLRPALDLRPHACLVRFCQSCQREEKRLDDKP